MEFPMHIKKQKKPFFIFASNSHSSTVWRNGIPPQHTAEVSTCGSVWWSFKEQLLSVPPWPGASTWQRRLGCEAHGGHYGHHGGALTPSPLTSVKSAWQRQPQQWALTVVQVREKVGTPCSLLCSCSDVETALERVMFLLLLKQQSTSYAFFVHAAVYVLTHWWWPV